MTNLQVPTQMPMPQDLPEVAPIGMMPQMRMGGMQDMQPRMMMAKGDLVSAAMAAGRNLPGRMKDLSNKILGRKKLEKESFILKDDGSIIPGTMPLPGRGGLTYPATALNRIKNTENAIIGGGLLGGAAVTDATQGFTEQASMQNMMLNSPEQLGKDLAGMRIGLDRLIDIASQKAQEIGAAPGEYVGRAQRAYEAEMEAERMKQLDAEQGLKNVSLLMAGGGEASSFPDLTGDGKVTQADILKGRGVYAEGDEVILSIDQKINNELKARGYPMDVIADLTAREKLNDVMRKNQNLLSPEEIAAYASSNRQDFSQSYIPKPVMGLTRKYAEGDEVMMMEETEMMAPGGDEIEASLMEVQGMQPEMQALDQYVQMVIEMVQAGASEAEVIESLRQAGLDDDDIAAVFQAVMETLQGSMEQGGIDAELAQLS
jgi:hypothetical protein